MKLKLLNIWYYIQASFWFLPSLLACAAVLLAHITTRLDALFPNLGYSAYWLGFSGDIDGATTILSTITSSMITVAGVVFSITIVVLSQASSQFGPRLIRNFMNIRVNQMVLGTFVATYMYGLLILSRINSTEESIVFPNISVTVAITMSFLSLGLMIYFIHNISESVQAQNIIARVHHDLDQAIDRLFPEKRATEDGSLKDPIQREYDIPETCDRQVCQVKAAISGYIQAVDMDTLLQLAIEQDLLINLSHRPGKFITRGSNLVTIWPGKEIDEALSKKINTAFIVGSERTLEQDVEFAVSQMVEIAVRALSPGINDPITAITCIDWLGDILSKLAGRQMPSSHWFDDQNRLRLICEPFSFEGMVNESFNMIRQSAQSVAAVSIHLLEVLAIIAGQTDSKKDHAILLRQAKMIRHGCENTLPEADDRSDLEKRYKNALQALDPDADGKTVE